MSKPEIIEADLTWTGRAFESEIQVEVTADGLIGRVGALGLKPTRRLSRQALLPGFVNAHSHAFQRGLRGQGERFPIGAGSFWTWREAMYGLVDGLDAPSVTRLAVQAFSEMRATGITTVGEFHYLHHSKDTDDFALDRAMLAAAAEVGIRLVLLVAYYRTGAIGQPLEGAQRRFETASVERYWEHVDALRGELPEGQSVGAVVHSIRAASLEELAAIHEGAVTRDLPLHIHVEEQRQEIVDCMAAYGKTPMRAILDTIGDPSRLTAVHCTHTTDEDRGDFLARGGRICLCPLTEGNLGDGLPTLDGVETARCSIGTDSNARIDMFEEMRWLEYGQRLRGESRGTMVDGDGEVARTLLSIATEGGASSLAIPAGTMATGALADLTAVDIESPLLAGVPPTRLLEGMVFAGDGRMVTATAVGGQWTTYRPAA